MWRDQRAVNASGISLWGFDSLRSHHLGDEGPLRKRQGAFVVLVFDMLFCGRATRGPATGTGWKPAGRKTYGFDPRPFRHGEVSRKILGSGSCLLGSLGLRPSGFESHSLRHLSELVARVVRHATANRVYAGSTPAELSRDPSSITLGESPEV
jgi:hypothetical protein